ncbi:MAG TPA: 30S ribosomal protein S6 [Polyangiaceae bacterium]|nr:30S ribosomal protein S6 [Polyangiaceae bacterium]
MSQAATQQVREYETIYILKPDVTRDAQERVATRVSEVIAREKARLTSIENWGRRPLAYPVKKKKRGVYVCLKYLGGGGLVAEVERNLGVLDDVVKYQTIQLRDAVDGAAVSINPEDVKFEAVDPPQPGEDEGERIEQILGFERSPERSRSDDDGFGDDDGGFADDEPQSAKVETPAVAEIEK